MAGGRLQTNSNLVEPAMDAIVVRARSASQQVYVQVITYCPASFVPSVFSFVDSLTGQSIGRITVLAVALGPVQYTINYGNQGLPLTKGAHLQLQILQGGATGRLHVEAYQLPLLVWSPYVAPSTAGFTQQ
jgi:hypothetical protein